jgi:formate-nitrite transporter family protein
VAAPEPEEIYRRTREEGRRRLNRPFLELAATALVGGFDIAFGVAVLGLVWAGLEARAGSEAAHVAGAVAFGVGFVFVVVGRSELFTENFLVPVAGVERSRRSWLKLAELWLTALAVNLIGGALLALILTSGGVLGHGAAAPLRRLAEEIVAAGTLQSFLSAIVAGALLTLMTWFVEGAADSLGVRIAMAWIVGAVVALGSFDHAIVSSIELLFGARYGADVPLTSALSNLGLAVVGNVVGGLCFVTLARSAQAHGARGGRSPREGGWR